MLVNLIILLGVGLIAGWVLLTLFTAWLLTHPSQRGYAYAVARGLPGDPGEVRLMPAPSPTGVDTGVNGLAFTSFTLKGTSGKPLHAWDITGGDPDGPIVIASHGWGESRVIMLSRLPGLWPAASRIVLWDSAGHGDSRGLCTLGAREADDLLAIIEYVRGSADHRTIVLYGFSLGAGVAIVAAVRGAGTGTGTVKLVIAEAPYRVPLTPASNVMRLRGLPSRSTLRAALALIGLREGFGLRWGGAGAMSDAGGFDRAEHAGRLSPATSLLVLVGAQDEISPVDEAAAIASAGRGEVHVIPGGRHTTLWTDPATRDASASIVDAALRALNVGARDPIAAQNAG